MIYDHPRSGSFIGLCPKTLRFNIFELRFLKTQSFQSIRPPWDVGMKVCSNVLVHMTKMASRPIYGKNLQNSPSLEPRGRWHWKLVYNIWYSSTAKFLQMMTLDWPWPLLWHGQICFLMLLHGCKLIQLVLIQHILCTQVSNTGLTVLWFINSNRLH